jgi:hypothetical protein
MVEPIIWFSLDLRFAILVDRNHQVYEKFLKWQIEKLNGRFEGDFTTEIKMKPQIAADKRRPNRK